MASYRRRRIAALAALALVAALAGVVVGALAGGGGGPLEAGDPARPEREVRFTVAASGDLLIHGPVFARALVNGGGRRYEFRPMLAGVRRIVRSADVSICHLEQPLTAREPSGEPVFRAPAELAEAIRWAGWDACTTASNHSLDGGAEGITFTLRQLDRQGIAHSGTNASPRAPRAAMLRAKGLKLALLAYVSDLIPGIPEPPNEWSLNFARAGRILRDARAARRAGAAAVIVSLHWGDEYQARPSELQRRLADRLTRSPHVTAVIGQHVHVVQPIRRVNGKPVIFGEGNLLSNQTAACCPVESQDGLVALLDFRAGPGGTRVERVRYVPTWVRHPDYRIVRAPPDSWRRTVATAGRGPGIVPLGGR